MIDPVEKGRIINGEKIKRTRGFGRFSSTDTCDLKGSIVCNSSE